VVEHFRILLRVQELDGLIRGAEQEIATFAPRRVEAGRLETADAASASAAGAVLEERELEHRRLESDLSDTDSLVEKLDAQVYEVTSKQAMDAIQNGLQAAKAKKSELEDCILELLESIEVSEQEVAARETAAREHSADHAREGDEMQRREPELRGEIEQRQADRAAKAGELDPQALRTYEDARRKAWPVLVQVEVKSCPACRIVIAPQKWVEIGRAEKLITCGSCHRIMYGEKAIAD
jgi:predicted  nucleic acid-binding Zn-ribbon protein